VARTEQPPGRGKAGRWFTTTRWSVVRAAADSGNPGYQSALSELCTSYWPPVYAFIRSRGHDPDEAQDLTQGFFTQLLDKKFLKSVQRAKGKFRSFILACVKHFLANEWDRQTALKRGGDVETVPLEMGDAESFVRIEPADRRTPEQAFQREWARTIIRRVVSAMEEDAVERGERKRFAYLEPHLLGGPGALPYARIAEELGTSEGAVRVGVHKLRKRFGDALREEIAHTVHEPEAIDGEIRQLISYLDS